MACRTRPCLATKAPSTTRRGVQKALAQAAAGDRAAAKRTIISAYLDHFEPYEPALRARDSRLVSDIEREFLAIRTALDAGKGGPPGGPSGGASGGPPGQ